MSQEIEIIKEALKNYNEWPSTNETLEELTKAIEDHAISWIAFLITTIEAQKEEIFRISGALFFQRNRDCVMEIVEKDALIESLQKENKCLTSALQDIYDHYDMETVVKEVARNSLSTQEGEK